MTSRRELEDEIDLNRTKRLDTLKNVHQLDEILKNLNKHTDLHINCDSYAMYIHFAGDLAKLTVVQRVLYGHGYSTTVKVAEGETSYSGWFHAGNSASPIWVSFTSSVCKRVQIGTKTVTKEEPIYEIKCGEAV